jgi:hypothetical protein
MIMPFLLTLASVSGTTQIGFFLFVLHGQGKLGCHNCNAMPATVLKQTLPMSIELFKLVIKGIFPLLRLLQKLSALLHQLTHKFVINLLALASLGFFCAVQGDQDK